MEHVWLAAQYLREGQCQGGDTEGQVTDNFAVLQKARAQDMVTGPGESLVWILQLLPLPNLREWVQSVMLPEEQGVGEHNVL